MIGDSRRLVQRELRVMIQDVQSKVRVVGGLQMVRSQPIARARHVVPTILSLLGAQACLAADDEMYFETSSNAGTSAGSTTTAEGSSTAAATMATTSNGTVSSESGSTADATGLATVDAGDGIQSGSQGSSGASDVSTAESAADEARSTGESTDSATTSSAEAATESTASESDEETGSETSSTASSSSGAGSEMPTILDLCVGTCSQATEAGCDGFDEEACQTHCYSLGLYYTAYLDCYDEFRAARECEQAMEYICPGTVDPGTCASAQAALLGCA